MINFTFVNTGVMRGPGQHGNPERRRLEQIMAADRHQAASDECHIRRRVQRRELTHRVHQHNLRVRQFDLRSACCLTSFASCWFAA